MLNLPNDIPQGSQLEPLLLIILMNSLVELVKDAKVWLCMDDIKISKKIFILT